MSRVLVIILISMNVSFGSCDYPEPLDVGEIVECDGVILTGRQFIKAEDAVNDIPLYRAKVAELEGTLELYDLRHIEYSKDLRQANMDLKQAKLFSTAGYIVSFSFGVFITGAIAKGLLQ